jgi:hypothetical protein
MTPRDVPGPLVIESLFPWLAALEPAAPQPLRRTRPEPPEPTGRPLTEAA